MKEQMTSVDVAAVVAELQRLIDAKLNKAYQHGDEIRLRLHSKSERYDLVIEAGKRIHLTKYPRSGPKIASSFSMLLRKHLTGGRVAAIEQYDFDRIVEIHIQRGDAKRVLVAELFSKGNVVLLDENRKIILPLKSMSFRDRKIKRGEQYEYPPSQMNPMEINKEELRTLFDKSEKDVVRTLASGLNMGGIYAEEVCTRTGIEKSVPAKSLDRKQFESVYTTLHTLFEPIKSGALKPHIVVAEEMVDVLPFELRPYETYERRYFDTFNDALDEFFSVKEIKKVEEEGREIKEVQLDTIKRTLKQQEEALQRFRQKERECIQKAERLYALYQRIDKVLRNIKEAREKDVSWDQIAAMKGVLSVDPSKGEVVVDANGILIALDVNLNISQNAERYYQRAKEYKKKLEGAQKALEKSKKRLEEVEALRVEVAYEKAPQRRVRQRKHWYDKFRWFFSSDGLLVVGGRDADTNEEIVKKYMTSGDVFFHADVHGAPVLIVKAEGKDVPETTLKETAQFAISYSSIWKARAYEGKCYWVRPEQVSKTPPSGEYLPKGSFVIRGRRNYMDAFVGITIGIEINDETRVVSGPPSAIEKRAKYLVEIEPGDKTQNEVAKEMLKMFLLRASAEDRRLIKQIASPDKIMPFLPPGKSRMKVRS
ncbi:MAG: ribosome rescue protein RqcH [Methanocellales archaeon]|nr:ribosome rescue protein RqcH [Methanocellales archaeon]